MFKKIHWLLKYYFFAFLFIFGGVFFLQSLEPEINWSLYDNELKKNIEIKILSKDCNALINYYKDELNKNFNEDYFGFVVRKDRRPVKGLNLLSYLKYHIDKNNCN